MVQCFQLSHVDLSVVHRSLENAVKSTAMEWHRLVELCMRLRLAFGNQVPPDDNTYQNLILLPMTWELLGKSSKSQAQNILAEIKIPVCNIGTANRIFEPARYHQNLRAHKLLREAQGRLHSQAIWRTWETQISLYQRTMEVTQGYSLPADDGGDPGILSTSGRWRWPRDTLYQRTMAVTQGYSLPADDGGDPGILSTSGRWRWPRDTLYQRTMEGTQGYSLPTDDSGDPGILT